MANRLTMATIDTILILHKAGHSRRGIARLTGVHRETVGKYVACTAVKTRQPAPTGSADPRSESVPFVGMEAATVSIEAQAAIEKFLYEHGGEIPPQGMPPKGQEAERLCVQPSLESIRRSRAQRFRLAELAKKAFKSPDLKMADGRNVTNLSPSALKHQLPIR